MSLLFSPLKLRGVELRNRIVVSPMCQYSAHEGFANDWHLVHLGSRAVGGAGAVIVEATAVEDRGRISPGDMGIWSDPHIEPLGRIARFIKQNGSVPGIQLAHAGRKGSTEAPWDGGRGILEGEDAWQPVAPSAVAFDKDYPEPAALTIDEIRQITQKFAEGARRAQYAGFEVIELHAAHGYLLHEFLSPLSNLRRDEYGGSFENRVRIVLEVIKAVRAIWPECFPLFLRISATDWAPGGWTVEDSIQLARLMQPLGVDLIDCSSGGLVPGVKIPVAPGYQVQFADRIHRETGVLTGAVGMITDAHQAEAILQADSAALIVMAREFLREPYWPLKAALELGAQPNVPVQYQRAFAK